MKKYPIETIRHSLAHVLATAVEELYPGVKLGVGPVIAHGFFYDFDLSKEPDVKKVEARMHEIIKEGRLFKKRLMPLDIAVDYFKKRKQPYKVELLKDLKKKGTTKISEEESFDVSPKSVSKVSIYTTGPPANRLRSRRMRAGDFVDLCRGPHVASTKDLPSDAFALTRTAKAYWRGKETNPQLTRIYGLAFQTKKELDAHLKLLEEAEKRDHRKLGPALDLVSFHDVAPGAPFWHPKGMILVNEIANYIRELQKARGYQETLTPILSRKKLFDLSGHSEYYAENMFFFDVDGEPYALKAMNCPANTFIYSSRTRSYRDLPLRLSEFGYLHRKERSGVLTGLARVWEFIQDDAHIYCRPDQILEEITGVLELISTIQKTFGLEPSFIFATKPDKALGDPKLWKKAEASLKKALDANELEYELRPKDGAFYGPKIDVNVSDALGREWTIATIQLDFQLPERFGLTYIDEKGKKARPVMIHRSSIGSFERFIAILIEHYAGAFPVWLSPIQARVIPVSTKHVAYAKTVGKVLTDANIRAEVLDASATVSKQVRQGELEKLPYLLVVGDEEEKEEAVRVRERGKGDTGLVSVSQFLKRITHEIKAKK